MKTLTMLVLALTVLSGCEDQQAAREKLARGVEVAKKTAESVTEKARAVKEKSPELEETARKVKEAAKGVKSKAKKVEDAAADFALPVEKAEMLGDRMSREILTKNDSLEGPAAEYVRELGEGIVMASGNRPDGISYDFWVIRDDAVNAFAIPGGHVFVTTGLLKASENEAELVAVLGHEVAHVIERHVAEGMVATYGVSVVTTLALGRDSDELERIVANLVGKGLLLKHSRDDEREADELGMKLVIDAGHSPVGYKTFFSKLAEQSQVPSIVSTHPNPGERSKAAASKLEALDSEVTERPVHEAKFRKMTAEL